MKQTHLILKQLKKLLKSQGMNYKTLGTKLKLSEASVKRVLSRGTMTLERLNEICEILEIDFFDLAKMTRSEGVEFQKTFTHLQELLLANNEKHFVYFYLLASGYKPSEIVKNFHFSESESMRILLVLDKNDFIQLLPHNRVKLLISRNVQWIKNGPLIKAYEQRIKDEFLQSEFTKATEYMNFVAGYLSEADLKIFQKKIIKLISEFRDISELNPPQTKDQNVWLLVAYRPWVFSIISKYKSDKLNHL